MTIDKKTIFIGVQLVIIIIMVIVLVRERNTQLADDAYLDTLHRKNKELADQLVRLKKNYADIGLVDSLQSRSTDSLIAISTKRLRSIREEAQTYRAALEEMQTREWKRLSESQKSKEIEEALNFLKSNEVSK
jgi:biopolymer transport protein ExbB/TolQ